MKALSGGLLVLLCAALLAVLFSVDFASNAAEKTPLASPAVLLEAEPGFAADAADDADLPSMRDIPQWGSGDPSLEPIAIAEAGELSIGLYTDVGFRYEDDRYVMDLLEQDYAYLTVIVTDIDGRPVVGAEPSFEMKGDSQLLLPEQVGADTVTGPSGTVGFALIGGPMALDELTVSVGEASAEMLVNVISLRASGFPAPPEIEGGIAWADLMSARISYPDEASIDVEFPPGVAARSGETVTLAGFMMPLDPDLKQRRFLLTSNPPSCFYHIPGGPAGAIEVLADEGIEATWDPIVVEGRFETLDTNEYGIIYRLHNANLQPY